MQLGTSLWNMSSNNNELGMNTPKGLIIRNKSGKSTDSSATITPPISNMRIVLKTNKEGQPNWVREKRPIFDRLIHLLTIEI